MKEHIMHKFPGNEKQLEVDAEDFMPGATPPNGFLAFDKDFAKGEIMFPAQSVKPGNHILPGFFHQPLSERFPALFDTFHTSPER
jgi:hypothetical protein